MRHCTLPDMLDELLEDPSEIIITSKSKNCVLYGSRDGSMTFLAGDFSGTEQECEDEVHRIMNGREK